MALTKIRRFKFWLRKQKVNAFCTMVRLLSFSKKAEPVSLPLPKSLNKILFLRTDGKVGDFIVSTFALQEMAKFYGNKIDVLSTSAVLDIAAHEDFVGKVIELRQKIKGISVKSKILNSIILGRRLRKEHYDLIIDLEDDGLKLETAIMLWLAKAVYRLSFNATSLSPIINVSVSYDFSVLRHISAAYNHLLAALGINQIKPKNIQYILSLPRQVEIDGQKIRGELKSGPCLVFNACAGKSSHNLSVEQIKCLLKDTSGVRWILIAPWQKLQDLHKQLSSLPNVFFPIDFIKSYGILGSLSLMKSVDGVVTVDTFAVHAAIALHKKLFAITPSFNAVVWGSPQEDKRVYLEIYPNGQRVDELASEKISSSLQAWIAQEIL